MSYSNCVYNKEEIKALGELKRDSNQTILTVDKGVAMVVMDREDYIDKANSLLAQPACRSIDRDPISKLKAKVMNNSQKNIKGNQD